MLNARKREASDPLLPTRQPKHPRVEHTTHSAGLAAHSGLTARWTQLAREAVELASETIKALGSRTSFTTSLPNYPPRLRRSPSPRARSRPHVRRVRTTSPSDPPPPPRPSIPNEFYPLRMEPATLSSSFSSAQYPTQAPLTSTRGSDNLQLPSTFGHPTARPYQTGDDLLAGSVHQCRRVEEMNNILSQRKSKEHIYARKVCVLMCRIMSFRLTSFLPRNVAQSQSERG